jgi:hypothetical protein
MIVLRRTHKHPLSAWMGSAGGRRSVAAPDTFSDQASSVLIASALTGVKKLTRFPSGSRNSSERLHQGCVVGSWTKAPMSFASFRYSASTVSSEIVG